MTVAQTTPLVETSLATAVVQSGPLPDLHHLFDPPHVAVETLSSHLFAEIETESPGDFEAGEAPVAMDNGAEIEPRGPAPKAATPAAASHRSGGPVRSRQGIGSMVRVAAAVVVVAAAGLGLGAYWFKIQGAPISGQVHVMPRVPSAAVAKRVSPSPEPHAVVEPATRVREITPVPARATPAPTTAAPKAQSATSSVVPPRVPPTVVRQLPAPARPVALAVVPAGVTVAPLHEAAPPPPPPPALVAEALPLPAPSAAPLGPFFETRDVNESPQVASRVEPQLPDDLRARELNDIVVVHVLVSQSGHPSSVSLLRRSKAGRSLDDAVVAAVKRWTFSPARKNGEAVSCWLNVGVPVARVN